MLPSVEGMGAKLGEGIGEIDFEPDDVWPIDFEPNAVVSMLKYFCWKFRRVSLCRFRKLTEQPFLLEQTKKDTNTR